MESLTKKPNIADWCYVPIWEQSFIPQRKGPGKKEPCHWLVFSDNSGLANRLINLLENRGNKVNVVETGPGFQIMAEKRYMIDPSRPEDYDSLFHDLDQKGEKPKCLLHLWNIEKIDNEDIDRFIDPCFYSLFNIVKGLDRSGVSGQIELYVVTSGLYKVNEDEPVYPLKAMIPAVLRTVRQEYSYITCRCIDIIPALPGTSQQDKLLENLDLELSIILSSKQKANVEVAAWRETNRWVQQFKPYPLEGKEEINKELLIRKGGVYLITGGMGGIGSVFARCLARDFGARLILVSRSPFPPEEQWEEWLRSHTGTDPVSIKIQECREMQAGGAQIMIASADVSNLEEMKEIIDRAEKRFGPINGLIHAAGVADYEGVIQRRNRLNTDKILAPKVKGTLVLDKILKNNNLDFAILCSSISFILAPVGQVGYNAANAFQDAFALAKGGRWMSIAWGAWQVGMSVEAVKKQNKDVANILEEAISPSEGMDILYLIFEYSLSRSVICPIDLNSLVEKMAPHDSSQDQTAAALAEKNGPGKTGTNVFAPRPSLSVDYIPPEDFFEKSLANNWQTYFGLDKVGIYDDFFELGGDSLKAMQVIANIQKEIGVTIPLGTFFESPNIKALAGFIRNKAAKDSYSAIENVEKKEFYELSPAQKRLYIQQQEDPSTIAYNLPRFYILEGNFDKEKSQNAFNELIKRHEILRTFFVMNKTGPVQRILDHIEFKIKDYDLKGKCKEEIMQTFISPFDLSRAPLLRVGIVDLEPGKFLLMIDIHHIAADGISLALLVNEFEALYKGHSLPALNLQYKDYSHWQNLHLSSGEIKRQEDYWTNLFTGEIPKLLLPLDFNRTMVRSSASNSISFSLGSEFEEKLRALAKEEEITLFISILAIYHILLFKISGQEDIIIGTVTSGRGHADLEKIIGMFVNTLALRNFSKPGKSFREFLFDVKKRTLAAFENQDFQFENLVEKLQDVREVGRNPLFDVVFSFISSAMLESELKEQGLKIRECTFKEGNTMFDFVLGVFDLDEKLGFVLQYNISLFKKSTIERFIIYFKEIVRSVLENKNIHIEDIMVSHDLQAAQSNIYKETQIDFEF
jgi:polyketide synthase PksN